MKITKSKLKQIIKEELRESLDDDKPIRQDWEELLRPYWYDPEKARERGERMVNDLSTGSPIPREFKGMAGFFKRLLRMKSDGLQYWMDNFKKTLTPEAIIEDCTGMTGVTSLWDYEEISRDIFDKKDDILKCISKKLNKLHQFQAIAEAGLKKVTDSTQKRNLDDLHDFAGENIDALGYLVKSMEWDLYYKAYGDYHSKWKQEQKRKEQEEFERRRRERAENARVFQGKSEPLALPGNWQATKPKDLDWDQDISRLEESNKSKLKQLIKEELAKKINELKKEN